MLNTLFLQELKKWILFGLWFRISRGFIKESSVEMAGMLAPQEIHKIGCC